VKHAFLPQTLSLKDLLLLTAHLLSSHNQIIRTELFAIADEPDGLVVAPQGRLNVNARELLYNFAGLQKAVQQVSRHIHNIALELSHQPALRAGLGQSTEQVRAAFIANEYRCVLRLVYDVELVCS
jgi:hypothetical protein